MKNIIVSGMMYGDEGKGTVVDYLVDKYKDLDIVRFTGGAQGIHHVTVNNELFKFSQLSSGSITLNNDRQICNTYFTKEFIVNIKNLVVEIDEIAKKIGVERQDIIKRLHINENCRIVTEFHKLIGIIRETVKEERRGSMSSGVSTTASLSEFSSLTIKLKDIMQSPNNYSFKQKLYTLQRYFERLIYDNKSQIKVANNGVDDDRYNHIMETLDIYTSKQFFDNEYSKMLECSEYLLSSGLNTFSDDRIIALFPNDKLFESSQGLLLDKTYGTVPNTTLLNINNNYAFELCKNQETKVVGVARALITRHGPGLFPTYDEYLNTVLSDDNQDIRKFVGKPKYGWFDTVLMKYSAEILKVDEIVLTCVDELFVLDDVKVCTGYQYSGDRLRSDLEKYFEYEDFDDYFVITKIKIPHKEVFQILKECSPVYLSLGKITPDNYMYYVEWIERYIHKKISIISLGPDRKDKIELI